MDSIFQRSLEDLIKGLRIHHIPTGAGVRESSAFISKCLDEIRREIKSTDPETKTVALQKLTYLHSLYAVDMSWAAFHSVELSSSTVFRSKRIAYLAASLSFNPSTTDVILLLTHQLRKDLSSTNPHEVSLALQTLYSISTPDLARDLTPELFTLLNSSKNFIKKKAIATVLRIFELYPDAVRVCFKRLVENLENSDLGVVSAVIGVFCELACKEPRSYLPLAPEFYRALVDSRNNWILIKVLKIFAKLAPLEPRLGRRVVEPICDLLRRTGAKSLAYECVRTIVTGLSDFESAMKLAVEKIREFLMEDDPNLKFLGLQALGTLAPNHLWAVSENKEVVIKSLSDDDVNSKLEALRLVMAMVSEDNVAEICRVLINYALKSDPEFCNEILGSILATCSRNYYEIIIDFDWYVALLGEMSRIPHCQKGDEIENQLIDIGLRVRDVRSELVHVGRDLLIDPALLGNPFIHRILSAAAWVSGEYVEFSRNPFELMEALLQPRTNLLPPSIRAVYIQSALKVLTFCLYSYFFPDGAVVSSSGVTDSVLKIEQHETSDAVNETAVTGSEPEDVFNPRSVHESLEDVSADGSRNMIGDHGQASSTALEMDQFTRESVVGLVNFVETSLSPMLASHEVEILDRVKNVLGFIDLIRQDLPGSLVLKEGDNRKGDIKALEVIKLLNDAFSEELGPVALNAQERVPLPDGLELKENLCDLDVICGDIIIPISTSFSIGKPSSYEKDFISVHDRPNGEDIVTVSESTSLLAEHRKRHGLYYLPSAGKEKVSDDYPPANDLSVHDKGEDETQDLVKLTEESLIPKKKLNQTKPRPVVVKFDDGDRILMAAKKLEVKDDLISGAVRDVLLGNDAVASTSRNSKSYRSSSRRSGKDKSSILELKGDSTNADSSELGKTSSRRSRHHSHGKEKNSRSSRKATSEHDQKDKSKSSNHDGRHKSRHRADGSVSVVAQSPVIPDFLL